MGESDSSMDAPITYNPMGDSEETDVTELEVSVSFGRFENDVLSWEKWSTFPTNKYLEEVEKCSTPGSVAQKKAYFEAHYKKIAARKAEQDDQDQDQKIMEDGEREPVDSEIQAHKDLVSKFCEAEEKVIELDSEVANSESEMSSDQLDEPKDSLDVANESEDLILPIGAEKPSEQNSVSGINLEKKVTNFENEMRSNQVDEPMHRFDMVNESKDLIPPVDADKLNELKLVSGIDLENEVTGSVNETRSDEVDERKNILDMANQSMDLDLMLPSDEVKDESSCRLVSSELHESGEAAVVKDEAPSLQSEKVAELPQCIDNARNARDNVSVAKEEKVKPDKMLKSKKVSTPKKATSTPVLKKISAASTPKSSLLSNNKLSRPSLSKSTMSESQGSSKKEYGTSPLIPRKSSRTETRRPAPTSLHTSLNLCPDRPVNSEPAPTPPSTTMRRSVFMEKMGDKDIVKRAFKAFRHDVNQLSSSSPDKPTLASQVPRKETSIKASVVGTPRKKVEGAHNVLKRTPQSSQSGLRKSSNSTRLPNTAVGGDRSSQKSVSSSYGLRSRDKSEKSKELSKKGEENANGKAAERTHLQSKVKKETETKRLSSDRYTKAKPIVGTAKLKSSLDKNIAK